MAHSPCILVTNDDGVHAEGLNALADAVAPLGEVVVVAPATEQSAVGHSLTMRLPLRVNRVAEGRFAVDGTPTDCVLLAVEKLLDRRPDLVVSGVNHGQNWGDDVTYSGTVSAAMEGTLLGIPSIAVSQRLSDRVDFAFAGRFAARVAQRVLAEGLPPDTLLNINLPACAPEDVAGCMWTEQGRRIFQDVIVEKEDPRGRPYYWIGGGRPTWTKTGSTDMEAVEQNMISITPLHLNLTNYESLGRLRGWEF